VESWTKDARQAEKQAQQDRAWELWLDCLSYREIGEQMSIDDTTGAPIHHPSPCTRSANPSRHLGCQLVTFG
jgi:hypothetical protein